MTKPTNTPSSTSNAATPTPGRLPIRPAVNPPATTTANASTSRVTGPRPQPGTSTNGSPAPRPLPPTPQAGSQNSGGSAPRPLPPTPQAGSQNSRVGGPRPLPGTPNNGSPAPRPLPPTPQAGSQNNRVGGPRPLPGTPNNGSPAPRPLPPTPQAVTQSSNNTGSTPQPARATQPHTTANSGNLRVFRDPNILTQFDKFPLIQDFLQVSPSDPLFLAVSYCVDTALRVLELPKGRHGLIQEGKKFATLMKSEVRDLAYKGDPDNDKEMGKWVGGFLKSVREDFPNVFVSGTLVENAVLVRLDRPANAEKDFKPKLAGIMCLDKWILDKLLHQAKVVVTTKDPTMKKAAEKNFQYSLFYMTVIIAHEIMHLFIWYTSGETRPVTPREMALYPPGKDKGESGEALELQLFGGYLKFREDTTDPLKEKQTGIPFTQTATGQGRQDVRMVDIQFMMSILDPRATPDFKNIFTPESTSHPFKFQEINKLYRSMSKIKAEQDGKTYELREKRKPGEAKFQTRILMGDMPYLEKLPATDLERSTTPLDPRVLVKPGN